MELDAKLYDSFLALLKSELVPALGCTEPIAIALAAAKAVAVMGSFPEHLDIRCSANMIKNVKSVTVPNSGGLKGIDIAAALGAVGGDSSLGLEVLSTITPEHQSKAKSLVSSGFCTVSLARGVQNLYIEIQAKIQGEYVLVEIRDTHTNISRIEKNGDVVSSIERTKQVDSLSEAKKLLNIKDILTFAKQVAMVDVADLINEEIKLNTAISDEGLRGEYGISVGKTMLKYYGSDDVRIRASAKAAAGSDARMSGCALPVVINSGSGNQGMTVSLPVIEFANELKCTHETLIRALVLANLIALLQKRYIGSLSAFCGAVSAATGAACGIAFLYGGEYEEISNTITNTLANIGGIVCDGAKPSCAAKIASALDAAIFAFLMGTKEKRSFKSGDGLVKEDAEKTIQSIGRMGREGMKSTDEEIINIMLDR